jgi:Ca-activated chloride channel family protein
VSFEFQNPLALLLLALIPVLVYLELRRGRGATAVSFSSTGLLRSLPRGWRVRLNRAPLVLRSLALTLLVVALARPMSGRDPIRNVTDGIAIQMVLDRSGSMTAGMQYRGEAVTRFEAVKSVFADFVLGNGKELAGRPDDLVGVIAFAGYPDTISPLTHSRDALEGLLKELDTIRQPGEDGTAIGDALALGAARLKTAEEELQLAEEREERFEIKSKVLILLTDGEQNAGKRSPAQGAALAREWGIKIYSIGVAASAGGGFSTSAAEMLEQIAESTGGLFRLASDERSLRAVYEEIDRLEKTEVEAIQYLSVREYFPAFALAALALLVLEILLAATLLRRLP